MIKNNFYIVFFGIFSFAATILGTFAYINYKKTHRLLNEGIKTIAIVDGSFSDKKGHVRYKLEYIDKHQQTHIYWLEKQSWTASLSYGDKVPLYYLPDKPQQSTIGGADAWFITILLSVFFVLFGSIGYIGLGKQMLLLRQKKHLQDWGISITTYIDDVYKNNRISVNSESPYIIRSTYKSPVDNKLYIFHSDNIWFNPMPYLQDSIRVKVNPDNYAEYVVETEFLKR